MSVLTGMSTSQIASLTTQQIAQLVTADIFSLTSDQTVALTTRQAAVLSAAQAAALTAANVAALQTADFAALRTAAVAALTTAQVRALTSDQTVALTTGQAAVLTTAQAAALTAANVAALQTADLAAFKASAVAALTTAQITALSTAHIVSLTTSQVAALTGVQVMGTMTTAQINAFTNTQTPHLTLSSPIILDLNGNGVNTLSITEGVQFDLFASGIKTNTGWVGGGDGLLVMDRNGDSNINDGTELFGTSTLLSNGSKAADGYAALAELDSNHDGVISSADAAFDNLRVWVDGSADGISQAGELKTLDSLGIASISLDAMQSQDMDNGNLIGLTSTYETTDGVTHAAADVWFLADTSGQPVAPEPDMRSRVVDLVQAMASFNDSARAASGREAGKLQLNPGSDALLGVTAGVHVSQMADVLKQFDTHGRIIGQAAEALASGDQTLRLNGMSNPGAGILALK